MKIKTRLSFQFTIIVGVILLFFSLLVYYFSYTIQLNKFRESLLERGKNTAILLINVSEVDSALLKKIHNSTISLQEEEIILTDSTYKPLYSYNLELITDSIIRMYSETDDYNSFSHHKKDGISFRHMYGDQVYYVAVMAFDRSRNENLSLLSNILLWSILASLWLSVLFSYFFSRRAIKPISNIISSVKEMNALQLNNRLDEGNKEDEIDQLAITFNEMFTNLELAFRNQEDFVSNASHELRTPLSIMISESDYILSQERSSLEYRKHISELLDDLKSINSLINSLLELAQINRNKEISFINVRIDEIVFEAIQQVKNKYPGRKIIPKILYPEEDDLNILGDDGLLTIAFRNLLDNACKFSDSDVAINFSITSQFIAIDILDSGIGIPQGEISHVIKPFKRASNAKYIGGFGIGLSLVSKILELHGAKFKIISSAERGTEIQLTFKRTAKQIPDLT